MPVIKKLKDKFKREACTTATGFSKEFNNSAFN